MKLSTSSTRAVCTRLLVALLVCFLTVSSAGAAKAFGFDEQGLSDFFPDRPVDFGTPMLVELGLNSVTTIPACFGFGCSGLSVAGSTGEDMASS